MLKSGDHADGGDCDDEGDNGPATAAVDVCDSVDYATEWAHSVLNLVARKSKPGTSCLCCAWL